MGATPRGPAQEEGSGTPREGPPAQKSAGIVDSQSVKTTGIGGEERGGYDPAKKVTRED